MSKSLLLFVISVVLGPFGCLSLCHAETYDSAGQEHSVIPTTTQGSSVDGFFGNNSNKEGFFAGKDLSSSNMFNSASSTPSFEAVESALPMNSEKEVKHYEVEIRNEPVDVVAEVEEEKKVEVETPEAVERFDNSLETAAKESSSDPRIRSALKASQEIREAIFGKKVVADKAKASAKSNEVKKREDSVRF